MKSSRCETNVEVDRNYNMDGFSVILWYDIATACFS